MVWNSLNKISVQCRNLQGEYSTVSHYQGSKTPAFSLAIFLVIFKDTGVNLLSLLQLRADFYFFWF